MYAEHVFYMEVKFSDNCINNKNIDFLEMA